MDVHIILYVSSQETSTDFYRSVLEMDPRLNVPGMTEFELPGGTILGLMPEKGIKLLLGDTIPDPALGQGIPRAELYMQVNNAKAYHRRVLENGGNECSPLQFREWGIEVAYSMDLDGHVLAFSQNKIQES